jgi:hypothetical protein
MRSQSTVSTYSASKEARFATTAASAALGASIMKRLTLRKEHNIGF